MLTGVSIGSGGEVGHSESFEPKVFPALALRLEQVFAESDFARSFERAYRLSSFVPPRNLELNHSYLPEVDPAWRSELRKQIFPHRAVRSEVGQY